MFRTDTPHDVLAACLLAARLPPGRDVLLVSADKSHAAADAYLEAMRTVSHAHPWAATADVSGLAMNRHWLGGAPREPWSRRARETAESMRWLRERCGAAMGLQAGARSLAAALDRRVDEVYITSLNHPDVQAMYRLFPSARKVYSPHGLASLHAGELTHYESCMDPARQRRAALRHVPADAVKGLLYGRDAVPPRFFRVDAAYSFDLEAPWAKENHSLSAALTRESMSRMFGGLPEPVRTYFYSLAERCSGAVPVLLLSPPEEDTSPVLELEVDVLARLARAMTRRERCDRLLVKPHPRNSDALIDRVCAAIAAVAPEVELVTVSEHRFLPIELVAAPFEIMGCAGLWSSSQATLRAIYGARAYRLADDLRELAAARGFADAVDAWIESTAHLYTPL